MTNLDAKCCPEPSPAPHGPVGERVPEDAVRTRVRVVRRAPSPTGPTRAKPAGFGSRRDRSPLSRGAGEGFFAALLCAVVLLLPGPAQAALLETPVFAAAVAKGELPPVNRRVPSEPSLAELETIGRPGGELRLLMASPKDTRLMVVYGYARLMAYTPALALVPDMLEAAEVSEDRVFTLRLRPGHKWSDGQPFTSEDFRYWFEDVAKNQRLSAA